MSNVFVLNTNRQPLDPVHPGRARILLRQSKAAVFKRYPFTIILKASVSTARSPSTSNQDRSWEPDHRASSGQGDDGRSRLHGGNHSSRSDDQEGIGPATSRSSGQKTAKNPLQKTPVQRSKTESRVASALSGKSTGKRLDLGQAAVPYQGNQPGTRQI